MENHNRPRFTLGDLYRELKACESAYDANVREADRLRQETLGLPKALHLQVQASLLRWQPDPVRMPGIDRIELLCNQRFGTTIRAEAVLRLRAEVCRLTSMELKEAEVLVLTEAADILEGECSKPISQPDSKPNTDNGSQADLSKQIDEPIRKDDPKASLFRDGDQWCDSRYAGTIGISPQILSKAIKKPKHGVRLSERRTAVDEPGKPLVFRRAELAELADAIPDNLKYDPQRDRS